jgi:hypothetical protein
MVSDRPSTALPWAWRKGRRRHVLPAAAAVAAALELHAEVPEAQRRVQVPSAGSRSDLRHRLAGKVRTPEIPAMPAARQDEQALAGRDQQLLHVNLL